MEFWIGLKLALWYAELQRDLDRRKPGTSQYSTQRREDDAVKILSGIFEGKISAEKWKTKLERYIGLKFDSYIFIPETANYTISTLSDDGSKLFIDNELVVNNDGIHWLNEAYGVVKLEKGFHKINISL